MTAAAAITVGPPRPEGPNESQSVVCGTDSDDPLDRLLRALSTSYGTALISAIVETFPLQRAPGQPLVTEDVKLVLEAVETSLKALAGVDYVTSLRHSTRADSPGTRPAVQAAGRDPAGLSAERRSQLDAALEQLLLQASATGRSPASPETAKNRRQDELLLLTNKYL